MDTPSIDLVEEVLAHYQGRRLSRREALARLAAVTGSMAFATTILAACTAAPQPAAPAPPAAAPPSAPATPTPAPSPTPVPASAAEIQFPGDGYTLLAYLTRPGGSGPFPAVLISPENQGIADSFKEIARNLATEGYVALALDTLSREGGGQRATPEQLRAAFQRPLDRHVQDFQAAFRYLQGQAFVRRDRIGMMGFCVGGETTWLMAARSPELRAAVPFYGANPPLEEVANIGAPVLAIYGALDRFINPGIPAIEAAMAQHGKVFEKEIYPNADHSFLQTHRPTYNAEAARAAWARTLAWFEKYLRA